MGEKMGSNSIRTREELKQTTTLLVETLQGIYNEKGQDFTFRVRNLARITNINPHIICNLRKWLPIALVRKASRGAIWITTFDGVKK